MTRTHRSPVLVVASVGALVVGLALLHAGCGGGSPSSPSSGGSPPVGATPTPTPSATATPPPTSGTSLPRSCQGLPAGTGSPSGCAKGQAEFFNDVRGAQDAALASFYRDPDTGQTIPVADGTKLLVPSAYLKSIVDALDAKGICAVYDGEEMNVRNGTGYNENYDLITSDGHGWVNYAVTCSPALPLPSIQPPPTVKRDPDCPLAASRALFCFRDEAQYDGDVYGALDDLIAEDRALAQPQIFDFSAPVGGADYTWRIINDSLYVSGMLRKLKARGFCAAYDGDEFNVKRGTNTFSENYDLTKAEGWSIRVYNATCREADF